METNWGNASMHVPEGLHLSISFILCFALVYTTFKKAHCDALATLMRRAAITLGVALCAFALLFCYHTLQLTGTLVKQPSTFSQMANIWSTVVNKDPNFAVAIVLITSTILSVTWYIVAILLYLTAWLASACTRRVSRYLPTKKPIASTHHVEFRRAA